jgi:bacterioferritin-associated ferredoxin
VPDGATWIAGQGPLLLLYAVQALRAGGRIAGILDLSDGLAPLRAGRHWRGALAGMPELLKGLGWRRAVARAGVPWISASELRAEGDGALHGIRFRADGQERCEPADLLLLHDGVIPSIQVTRALGCAHQWDAAQQCWKPACDEWGGTSLPTVLVAGDGAGIGGAQAAALSGRIAALQAALLCGRIDAAACDAAALPLRRARARHLALRPLLDTLYAPLRHRLADDTLVCRCEEVTAGAVRQAARLGCLGLNQLKAFTRCGMGPCQGRMCGPVAGAVLAEARGVAPAEVEPYRTRFPTKPVTVGDVAGVLGG